MVEMAVTLSPKRVESLRVFSPISGQVQLRQPLSPLPQYSGSTEAVQVSRSSHPAFRS